MARWCAEHGVQLAPHGKTHMSPQLCARQLDAGACAITVATISQVRTYRAFGISAVILANELVDAAGLHWLAAELNDDPDFDLTLLGGLGARRRHDDRRAGRRRAADAAAMCASRSACRRAHGLPDRGRRRRGRTGRRSPRRSCGWSASPGTKRRWATTSHRGPGRGPGLPVDDAGGGAAAGRRLRIRRRSWSPRAAARISTWSPTCCDRVARRVWRFARSCAAACYLTHDDGLYQRTSPLACTPGAAACWAQVVLDTRARPGPAHHGPPRRVVRPGPANAARPARQHRDQAQRPARVSAGRTGGAALEIGAWVEFGISHPCTVFDKWQMIPVLDDDDRVVELIRTFF